MDDLPALREFAENQRKQPVRIFPVRSGEMEFAADQGGIRRKREHVQIGKFEFAHFMAFALVTLAISVKGFVPAVRNLSSGEECQLR